MALGTVNVPGTASTAKALEAVQSLIDDIVSGTVTTAMLTEDGESILTEDGEELLVTRHIG